jgi:hypothetical protein
VQVEHIGDGNTEGFLVLWHSPNEKPGPASGTGQEKLRNYR